ncbi:IS30 family transposase [Nesterenkonia marinintestina]|uniref:IS30 family transposase n=1 Tax=Nesterenkonia marinintestina TaxID=2979865 RepID=UPI0021BEF054|nr:IS30 family transposase [Nesterenkonia sp. GX14115]
MGGSPEYPWVVKKQVFVRLVRGEPANRLAIEYGLANRTIQRWCLWAGLEFRRGYHGGLSTVVDMESTTKPGARYHRLSVGDRAFIEAGLSMDPPMGVRQIAARLQVAASTVSREIARGSTRISAAQKRYCAELAQHQTMRIRRRPRARKLDEPRLRGHVIRRLNRGFSPEQVAGDLRRCFPARKEMQISHETIYQGLYVQGRGALAQELKVEKALRSGRTHRVPASKLPARSKRPWVEGARLVDRPAEVTDRAVPGHWEGDLVVGPQRSGLVTLVERSTRFALIGRLPGTKDSTTVIEVLTRLIQDLPEQMRQTLTWDQGPEMALHPRFTLATGCKVFFCDPHSPWQRGANENLNRLIRDFYPKGTDFNTITDEHIGQMQLLLNTRPRKTLDFQTPIEALNKKIRAVALTP